MGARIDVTPAEAKARWEEMGRPSYAKVAEAFTSEGRTISRKTISAWAKEWKGKKLKQPGAPFRYNEFSIDIVGPTQTIEPLAESDGELVRQVARQALDAARNVFHTLAHVTPETLLDKPLAVGALAEKMANAATLATEALAKANGIAAENAKPVIDQPATRSRADDPLTPALEAYERALQQGAPH